ncbi:MAG TPA: bifunctional glutamate N-acetyltransferase/amino-acid acetyltransferase ArgJ [Solirubrobacteraceae bacterium]|nr:bifunctional glutamate N-acetyltransferase/amino-acid acetyltransferase ArgJ [Solirubrobacteraceae bacterium]
MAVGTSTFSSRWVERPAHVRDLPGGLPRGFRAAGVAAGIKPSGRPDVALLVSDIPDTTSAARFTRSATQAPPVLLTRERCRLDALRAVAVNAGNANCAVGDPGLEAAARMQAIGARLAGVDDAQCAVCSTGVIGVALDVDAVARGLEAAAERLADDGEEALAGAIRTTDAFEKHASLEVELPSGSVRLSAQAKGAGMIAPAFSATLLCFVQTDAALSPETADLLFGVCVKRSFDRVTVDGQLSTNDTALLLCSGASGVRVEPQTEDELRFGEALDALLRRLALLIVRDGEGARRVGRVVVRGGEGDEVEAAARAVADSPLVKTALYGGDPNWGRIVQAVGMALPGAAPLALDVDIEGVAVCRAGAAVAHDHADLACRVARDEVEYVVGLPGSGAETEVFFSDLGHEYVNVNAEYTT